MPHYLPPDPYAGPMHAEIRWIGEDPAYFVDGEQVGQARYEQAIDAMLKATDPPRLCNSCRWWGVVDDEEENETSQADEHGRKVCWALEEAEDEDACGYAIDEPGASLMTKPTFGCSIWEQRPTADWKEES